MTQERDGYKAWFMYVYVSALTLPKPATYVIPVCISTSLPVSNTMYMYIGECLTAFYWWLPHIMNMAHRLLLTCWSCDSHADCHSGGTGSHIMS